MATTSALGGRMPVRALDPESLAERADFEITRADRYARDLAVVVFEPASRETVRSFAESLIERVRRWDMVGVADGEPPLLVAVLPETNRQGALGLLERLGGASLGVRAWVAAFPADGRTLHELVEAAVGNTRHQLPSLPNVGRPRPAAGSWSRWSLPGNGALVVLCPACEARYTWQPAPRPEAASGLESSVADAARTANIEAALTLLAEACPRHPSRFAMVG
jgi:hypothetical protein